MPTFQRVLVPLDGSVFSSQALDLLDAVPEDGPKEVTLMQVVSEEAPADSDPMEGTAAAYLREVGRARGMEDPRIVVRSSRDAAEEILDEAARDHDLVVMMTHGRGGVNRWLLGSVAGRVVRHSNVPVLVGNSVSVEGVERIERILVPLDGSALAAQALPVAASLASRPGIELVLFSAGWVAPGYNPAAYTRDVDVARAELEAYLAARVDELRGAGVEARSRVAFENPVVGIVEATEETESDLVLMTTHGRTGIRRWLLGSVAEKVLRASPRPVLLLRVDEED